ncbi:MAG TPA: MFS transporter [Candidatus Hydrogenedentes bacterium]|nr:MAG: Glycerol-3-phosphate transporter [Candidatus Hydrogenedentes bacterium ADurb.Bin170]HOD94369.1 MFS transporter [Candidatus Hydrogenedentota bacterium]HOM46965.1 MFS transporter [Candidatus Hydrogenedentota bacterium]HOR49808.1 MFS transporter [Candidatus Hydrogenedentota bacterium]HPK23773.1 MFS transporter [Candidatus Hydrogenedentota bacterium]
MDSTDFIDESRPLSRDQQYWQLRILISTYFGYAGYYLVRKVFTICKSTLALPVAEGGYGMGFNAVANIWTAYLVAYMLGMFVSSFIGRKWGPRVLLLGGLALSMLCNVIFGFANSYPVFVVFMFFNGLVQAAGWPGTVGAVAEWLRKKERGAIMGFWSTNYLVGNILVKSLGGFLLATYSARYSTVIGVRYSFLGCTLLAFAFWWLLFFWQRNKPEDAGLPPIVSSGADEARSVEASQSKSVTFRQYTALLFNPIVPLMGCCYFCIKFLRYALDSWLPTFLELQGLGKGQAAYYSSIFDGAGLAGAILAGIALDQIFKGRWDRLCFVLSLGTLAGYTTVTFFGANPRALALCFGLVGFMLYGPDTLLCGAGSVVVAGERNAVAVAGLVNGMGSIGPIIQEQLIGRLMEGRTPQESVRIANSLGLYVSCLFVLLMALIFWQTSVTIERRKQEEEDSS